jgi:hypothetical protein
MMLYRALQNNTLTCFAVDFLLLVEHHGKKIGSRGTCVVGICHVQFTHTGILRVVEGPTMKPTHNHADENQALGRYNFYRQASKNILVVP